MYAWQVSKRTPKFGLPLARTASTSCTISDGLFNMKPGSNSQQTFMPWSAAILLHLSQTLISRSRQTFGSILDVWRKLGGSTESTRIVLMQVGAERGKAEERSQVRRRVLINDG